MKHIKDEANLRDEELLRSIQPTDEKTMNKILSFANTVNQTMDHNGSPTKIASNQNYNGNHLYKTISDKNSFRRESSKP